MLEAEVPPEDWDPPEHEREYVRDSQFGDLGWIVRRAGEKKVRMDLPQEVLRDWSPHGWKAEPDPYQFTKGMAVRIAFEADKQLCGYIGMHQFAKREWGQLTDQQKEEWVTRGPKTPFKRAQFYRQVLAFFGFSEPE